MNAVAWSTLTAIVTVGLTVAGTLWIKRRGGPDAMSALVGAATGFTAELRADMAMLRAEVAELRPLRAEVADVRLRETECQAQLESTLSRVRVLERLVAGLTESDRVGVDPSVLDED